MASLPFRDGRPGLITLAACLVLVVQMLRAPASDILFADRERAGDGCQQHTFH